MAKTVFVFLVLTSIMYASKADSDILAELTRKFTTAYAECRNELNLPDSVKTDFINFWKEDYELTNRLTGCAIMCLSAKLNLHTEDGKINHAEAKDFAMKHGASEELALKLVDVLHECQQSAPQSEDACMIVLEISKCFKTEIHKLNWAPPSGLGEMIAEI